jgi:predicted PurR-regulated permease PerM
MDSVSRTLVTLVFLALLGWALWLVRDVLPPFLIGLGLALLLDPVLDRMERGGIPRWAAVAVTFVVFLGAFFAVLALVVPRAVAQVAELVRNMDQYALQVEQAVTRWTEQNADLLRRLRLPVTAPELWAQYQGDVMRYLQVVLQRVFTGVEGWAGRLGWVIIIPIVTLYLMIDLDRARSRLLYLIAEDQREWVMGLATKVGQVFIAYLRALVLISALYGTVVYAALSAGFNLPYSIILGLLAGVLYAVPYLGQIGLILVTAAVAWLAGRTGVQVLQVVIVLVIIGQIFDQVITPRLIGKQVGLHPAIGLFALMCGAQLFGLAGMVFAVPVAAAVRVVLIELYPRLGDPLPAETEAAGAPQPAAQPEGLAEPEATAPEPSA